MRGGTGRLSREVATAKDEQEGCSTPVTNASQGGAEASSPPRPQASTGKKIGRPKGSKNKPKDSLPVRVERTFKRMVADALPLALPVSDDGGGTLDTAPSVTRESLERRVSRRLNVLDRYLTDQRLHELLMESKLKEIAIAEAIYMDKSLVLKGQPNIIVGATERTKLNEVLPALLTEMRRRNMVTTLKERSISFADSPTEKA